MAEKNAQDNRAEVGGLPERLLAQQHQELLRAEWAGRVVGRIIGVLAFCFAVVTDLGEQELVAVAVGVAVLGFLSHLWIGLTERRRARLEELIIQEHDRISPGSWWKKVYAEWQHEIWKKPLPYSVIRIEPLIWAALTIMTLSYRYLLS